MDRNFSIGDLITIKSNYSKFLYIRSDIVGASFDKLVENEFAMVLSIRHINIGLSDNLYYTMQIIVNGSKIRWVGWVAEQKQFTKFLSLVASP